MLHLPAQVIVEAQHLGDESRAEMEGDFNSSGRGGARRRLRDDVAFERRDETGRIRQSTAELFVQLLARRQHRRCGGG